MQERDDITAVCGAFGILLQGCILTGRVDALQEALVAFADQETLLLEAERVIREA